MHINDNSRACTFDATSAFPTSLGEALEREAQLYLTERNGEIVRRGRTYIVADFEYRWCREAFKAYQAAEGRDVRSEPLWPYCEIVAASWLVMRFRAGEPVPEIEPPVVMAADSSSEREIVEALFSVLAADPFAKFVTWGGEAKDHAVLRRCAATLDLVLPLQLRDGSPHCPSRLDLCRATVVQADKVHLPELATAVAIPAKPHRSRSIGRLVEEGRWPDVREQVLADVLTAVVLAVRHLTSHAEVRCERADTMVAIADAASAAVPASAFVKRTFAPWAKAARVRAGLRGAILAPV